MIERRRNDGTNVDEREGASEKGGAGERRSASEPRDKRQLDLFRAARNGDHAFCPCLLFESSIQCLILRVFLSCSILQILVRCSILQVRPFLIRRVLLPRLIVRVFRTPFDHSVLATFDCLSLLRSFNYSSPSYPPFIKQVPPRLIIRVFRAIVRAFGPAPFAYSSPPRWNDY